MATQNARLGNPSRAPAQTARGLIHTGHVLQRPLEPAVGPGPAHGAWCGRSSAAPRTRKVRVRPVSATAPPPTCHCSPTVRDGHPSQVLHRGQGVHAHLPPPSQLTDGSLHGSRSSRSCRAVFLVAGPRGGLVVAGQAVQGASGARIARRAQLAPPPRPPPLRRTGSVWTTRSAAACAPRPAPSKRQVDGSRR